MSRPLAWSVIFLAVPLGAALTGCGAGPAAGDQAAAADTVVAMPALTIGVEEGDPAYEFGHVRAVAADDAGRIYVADRIGSTVRVYSPDGEFLRQIGREGEGPGEFQWPVDIAFGPDGRLYVRDIVRITAFAARRPGEIPDSVTATWRLPGYGNTQPGRSVVTADGRYLYPYYRMPRDEPPSHFYLIFSNGSLLPDTLFVPEYANRNALRIAYYPLSPGGGRMVHGLSYAPFAPVPVWAVTPDATVLSGDGAEYVLHETGLAGDTIRVLVGPEQGGRPVPPRERSDSARALAARIDSLPVPIDEVVNVGDDVREGRIPEPLPAFIGLHVATDGTVWVERWPPEGRGEERHYDVLDREGRRITAVVVPLPLARDLPPYITGDAIYGVVRDPETDIDRVVKAEVRIPALRTVASRP